MAGARRPSQAASSKAGRAAITDPSAANPSQSLVDAFQEIARRVQASDDFEDTYARLSATAVDTIAGCDAASISTVEPTGPRSHGVTDPLAGGGDAIQYEEGEGPCLDAAMRERWVYIPDMSKDDRWPTSSRRLVEELGVGSMLSCRLALDAAPSKTLGGINMYSRAPDAFSQEDRMLAILLSSLGGVVVDASRQQAHLRQAIQSRQVIGEAIGIMRAQGSLSSQQAFDTLAKASQRMNVKLRDLAAQIAEGGTSQRGGGP